MVYYIIQNKESNFLKNLKIIRISEEWKYGIKTIWYVKFQILSSKGKTLTGACKVNKCSLGNDKNMEIFE